MRKTNFPLSALTAEDLMSREVTMLPQEMSLQAAAHRLSQAHVTGAPVVDATGRCVGVLSATDYLHLGELGDLAELGETADRHRAAPVCVCSDWQMVDAETETRGCVRGHMTPDPVFVQLTTPIAELTRMMLDAHIHRVIVVDEHRHPVGVVSSTDVLAAVAYSDAGCEEFEAEIHCPV
jgi:CBS-domain-containing membrane protein